MATRSNSPVTEYTSETSGIWAIASAVSGMRVTSAFTRTIAVTTAASSARSLMKLFIRRPRAQSMWAAMRRMKRFIPYHRAPAAPAARVAYLPAQMRCGSGADLGERAHAAAGEPAEQAPQHVRGGPGVGQGAMARPGPGAEE